MRGAAARRLAGRIEFDDDYRRSQFCTDFFPEKPRDPQNLTQSLRTEFLVSAMRTRWYGTNCVRVEHLRGAPGHVNCPNCRRCAVGLCPTLFVVATCVTALLGLFLLFAWMQDRVRALAWWGCCLSDRRLFGRDLEHREPDLAAAAARHRQCAAVHLLRHDLERGARCFTAVRCSGARMCAGATVWLLACMMPDFLQSTAARIMLSSVIIAVYTFLTAAELWRERRKTLLRRWPAIFVPMLHGAVFLFPIPLASLLPADGGVVSLASGWIAVFALETMLYVVGTAFIVLVLAKERTVRIHKDAASTDELTGLLNRRGFFDAAQR